MSRVIALMAFGFMPCGLMLVACSTTMPSLDFMKSAPQAESPAIESEPPGAEAKTSLGQSCRTPCQLSVQPGSERHRWPQERHVRGFQLLPSQQIFWHHLERGNFPQICPRADARNAGHAHGICRHQERQGHRRPLGLSQAVRGRWGEEMKPTGKRGKSKRAAGRVGAAARLT